ncbi:MAG: hypothetical protein JZU53_07040 [Paludibacter sp.]|nr:hypothetical protein [Paludibacter sp.]
MVTPLITKQSYFFALSIAIGLMKESDLTLYQYTSIANRDVNFMRFAYKEEDLFDEVRKRTYYIAKMQADKAQEERMMGVIALTQDDKELFDPFYRQTTTEVLERLSPFTRNISPAYLDRAPSGAAEIKKDAVFAVDAKGFYGDKVYRCTVAVTISATPLTDIASSFVELADEIYTDDKLVLFAECYPWMNANSIPTADTNIFEAIVLGIMAKWFVITLPGQAQAYEAMYANKLMQISGTLNTSNQYKRKFTFPN